jgi:PhzF family phenazine biosynthesis protein
MLSLSGVLKIDFMKIPLFQVDAFSDHLFGGNPAAVCPLEEWLPDKTMQNIAMENNLAETAFFVNKDDQFAIRWFTPLVEVDLCGHATLASAHVIFNHLNWNRSSISFMSRSGLLIVTRNGDLITLNFPSDDVHTADPPEGLLASLNIKPLETYAGKTDFMIVLSSQREVELLDPDFSLMKKSGGRGVIVTAKGDEVDFVSRFFAPQVGVDEDPVTGSAHTTLIPYWSKQLGKSDLTALQLSKRKGCILCKYKGDRVEITGKAITYLTGQIVI